MAPRGRPLPIIVDRKKLATTHLLPGMPVEVCPTTERTVLSCLMKPLADQVHRAFREK
ncbi:ribose 5-phosphate isomerase [Bradyrhizobium sp. USDA 4502]